MSGNVGVALGLTAAAGLSTTVGSLFALVVKEPGRRFMGFTLGFSAGVMILISFVALLAESIESIKFLPAHLAFFIGMGGIFLIDILVPHEYIAEEQAGEGRRLERLKRTGLLVAFGIGIHNFPEGMATFAGALKDVHLGLAIAVAIALRYLIQKIRRKIK